MRLYLTVLNVVRSCIQYQNQFLCRPSLRRRMMSGHMKFQSPHPILSPKNVLLHRQQNLNLTKNLIGKIVFIPNADPGFDWLFSCDIAGLVTAWGGANSHMAIRSGELGLPAVIGAGDVLFDKWQKAETILLDCAGKRVEALG